MYTLLDIQMCLGIKSDFSDNYKCIINFTVLKMNYFLLS